MKEQFVGRRQTITHTNLLPGRGYATVLGPEPPPRTEPRNFCLTGLFVSLVYKDFYLEAVAEEPFGEQSQPAGASRLSNPLTYALSLNTCTLSTTFILQGG